MSKGYQIKCFLLRLQWENYEDKLYDLIEWSRIDITSFPHSYFYKRRNGKKNETYREQD